MASLYLLTIIIGTFLQVGYSASPYENYRHPSLSGDTKVPQHVPNESPNKNYQHPKLTDDLTLPLPLRKHSDSPYENYRHPRLTDDVALPLPQQVVGKKISNDLDKYVALEELIFALQAALWKVPDTCQNISKTLDHVKTVTGKASSLIGEIATKLSGTWEESFQCITINVYKAVTCLMDTVKGYKEAYEEYKPKIDEMNLLLQNEFFNLFTVVQECLANL